MTDPFLPRWAPAGQAEFELREWIAPPVRAITLLHQANDRKLHSAHTKGNKHSIYVVSRCFSSEDSGWHTHLEVQDAALSPPLSGKYLMPRCTRTERQCLALFVPGAPVFWTANKRVTVCSFVTSSCCAINWFRWKQKRKWGSSWMLLTQATHLLSENSLTMIYPRCTISELIPTRLRSKFTVISWH